MAIELHVIVIGDAGVGKTSLAVAMETRKPVPPRRPDPTIGVDFTTVTVPADGHSYPVTVRLWDTAGQERYRSLLPAYFRRKAVVFLVFDVTRQESLASCVSWMRMVDRFADETAHVVLVGTKRDARDRKPTHNCVAWSEGQTWAAGRHIPYREVSAVTLDGVNALLTDAVQAALAAHPPDTLRSTRHPLAASGIWLSTDDDDGPPSSGCCPG